ncbi:MAG: CapA family protein [Betaproteobacteria bacterium]|nr:CapA family protein [Betaproteobacteria bacterium]
MLGALGGGFGSGPALAASEAERAAAASRTGPLTLFLAGDVMTGRGIDQVLPHPGDPRLFEPYLTDARGYVQIAEQANGPIPKPVDFACVWGDALEEFRRVAPDAKVVNLETAVTASDDRWKGKGIHYRMHPANVPILSAAGIDCCALANNHVLDWGYHGLEETLVTLKGAAIRTAGAGRDQAGAATPAVLEIPGKARVLVFAYGSDSSGIPGDWAAGPKSPGVNFLPNLSTRTLKRVAAEIRVATRSNDIVVASIHWGSNWGYGIPAEQVAFARGLIDEAGVDIVHGHSSHHPRAIEVYRERLILYGCGDFLNDYEGIRGYEQFRGDLVLMYFGTLEPASGRLLRLSLTPLQIRRFRLNRAAPQDARWLAEVLHREGARFGTRVAPGADGTLEVSWR